MADEMIMPNQMTIEEREHQKDLQRLRGFRPIDDFMRGLFKRR